MGLGAAIWSPSTALAGAPTQTTSSPSTTAPGVQRRSWRLPLPLTVEVRARQRPAAALASELTQSLVQAGLPDVGGVRRRRAQRLLSRVRLASSTSTTGPSAGNGLDACRRRIGCSSSATSSPGGALGAPDSAFGALVVVHPIRGYAHVAVAGGGLRQDRADRGRRDVPGPQAVQPPACCSTRTRTPVTANASPPSFVAQAVRRGQVHARRSATSAARTSRRTSWRTPASTTSTSTSSPASRTSTSASST